MDNSAPPRRMLLVRLVLPLALICLAAAIAYFSYALLRVVDAMPDLLKELDRTSTSIAPVVAEADALLRLVPEVLEEIAAVRAAIPAILDEVKQVRKTIPPVLSEWRATRKETIPPILQESAALRDSLPALLVESQGYRTLVPQVLDESEQIRAVVPVALTRVERIVTDAQGLASTAGEGAVTGLFTGILKTPFSLVSSAGDALFNRLPGLDDADRKLLERTSAALLVDGASGDRKAICGKGAVTGFVVIARDYQRAGRHCRDLRFDLKKGNKRVTVPDMVVCRQADGTWVVEDN